MSGPDTVAKMLADCGAVIQGSHFVYASARHGSAYVNKDALFLRPNVLSAVALRMALTSSTSDADVVAGPAVGGAIIASWVGSHLKDWQPSRKDVRAVFADKGGDGSYFFARGYGEALAGKRVLVVEDILTTGSTCKKTIEAVRASGGNVVGACAIVNRGGVIAADIGAPSLVSLVDLDFQSWAEAACPFCATGVPVRTDLGKGAAFLARQQQPPQT
jgi:orotate phosphoribosyltransferase